MKRKKSGPVKLAHPTMEIHKQIRKCGVCGKKFFRNYEPKKGSKMYKYIITRNMCYECAYWSAIIDSSMKNLYTANGIMYKILPFVEEPQYGSTLGSKGKTKYFITKSFEAIKSNDVWVIGKIPKRFRDKLKDTGWFCEKRVYENIFKFNGMCHEVGCLDRYTCFRFITELEIKNGPFNAIPKNWKEGSEHCGFMIKTKYIHNYNSPLIINRENGTKRKNPKN